MKANEHLNMGVVVERRDLDNRWEDYSWHPVAIIPGAPVLENAMDWRLMRQGEGWSQFHIGTLALELFRGETEGYRANLSADPPLIYVVLSHGEEADEPDVVPFLITVCPYEAESYTESGEEIVEGVPMPPEIANWIGAFVERYHVDQPFKKRKQKKAYDPRKGGFAKKPRVQENGGDRG